MNLAEDIEDSSRSTAGTDRMARQATTELR